MEQEFLIIAEIPEPLATRVVELRRRYDHWSEHPLPPHITMVRPLRNLPEGLRQAAKSLEYPFTITLQGWYGFRNPDQNVVWLDPGQDEPRRVAAALYAAYPELTMLNNGRYQPGKPHTYHVTVANHIPDDHFAGVMAELRSHQVTGSCQIERLTAYRRDLTDGEWQLV